MMNLVYLERFVKAAKLGTYAAAGRDMHLTAPAVARSIHELEVELGVSLVHNKKGHLCLTDAGRALMQDAQDILEEVAVVEARIKTDCEDAREGSVRLAIAASPFRGTIISAGVIRSFCSRHPAVDVHIERASSGACLAALEEDAVDAAVVLGQVEREGLSSLHLFSFEMHAVLSEDNPLARKDSISLVQLSRLKIARPYDIRYCLPLIIRALQDKGEGCVDVFPSLQAHRRFVDKGGVIFAVPEAGIRRLYPHAVMRPVRDVKLAVPVYLVFDFQKICKLYSSLRKHLTKAPPRI